MCVIELVEVLAVCPSPNDQRYSTVSTGAEKVYVAVKVILPPIQIKEGLAVRVTFNSEDLHGYKDLPNKNIYITELKNLILKFIPPPFYYYIPYSKLSKKLHK